MKHRFEGMINAYFSNDEEVAQIRECGGTLTECYCRDFS